MRSLALAFLRLHPRNLQAREEGEGEALHLPSGTPLLLPLLLRLHPLPLQAWEEGEGEAPHLPSTCNQYRP